MEKSWSYRRRVHFHETDMAGVVHFSRQLAMIEEAEHAFFRERGLPCINAETGWPRVRLEVDYRQPLRFGQEVEIRLQVGRISTSTLQWKFEICRDGQVATSGTMTTCHVNRGEDGSWGAAPIPEKWKALLAD